MRKKSYVAILILIIVIVTGCTLKNESKGNVSEGQTGAGEMPDDGTDEPEPSEQADPIVEQVSEMSLEDKIGQLMLVGFHGTYLTAEAKELIHQYKVGGFIFFAHNLEDPSHSVDLLNDVKRENEVNDIPVFLSVDQEGGRVTRLPGINNLPTNATIGLTDDDLFAFQYGELLGDLVKAFGFQLNFAPVLDINSNPNNPVIGDRAYGNDPNLVSKMGIGTIEGMQSKGVIPAVKHFPGHGDTSEDSHESMPTVNKTLAELEAMELIPFQQAIEAGVDVVMTSHIALPKLNSTKPATMSKEIINDLLREQLKFDGVVITDDLTMGAIADYGVAEAANEAIKAGVDIVLVAFGHEEIISTFNRIKQSVKSGEITEERIDESVIRILKLKEKYELVDEVNEPVDTKELQRQINTLIQ